jgi:N-acetylmuramoyl-L-alanine amidase
MYEGFDPNQDEDYITLTMFQDAFLEQSTLLADEIQRQFRERVKQKDRGVWQAGFLVLYKTAMPGVLVETGFITNSSDERFLMSEDGQAYLASAIYRAFKNYKEEMERDDNKAKPVSLNTTTQPGPTAPEIFFRVQFLSSKKRIPLKSKKFDGIKDVNEYKQDGYYKYTSGNKTDLDAAIKLQETLREKKKYKDAFIIAIKDGQRISMKDAMDWIKK